MLGFVLVSIAVLHTLFASRINEMGGLVFFAALTIAYLLLKRRQVAPPKSP
jgi:DMSO/TMAO reductase YedYZ heme-binding membrane subunit